MLVHVLIAVVLFAAFASRGAYGLTARALGRWVADAGGCATRRGVLLHAVLFAAAAWAVMRAWYRRREGMCSDCSHLDNYMGGGFRCNRVNDLCCNNRVCIDTNGQQVGLPAETVAARTSLRKRKKARAARYADARARGDMFGKLRYNKNVGAVNKFAKGSFNAAIQNAKAGAQRRCPANWEAQGTDMCCERWWPDDRKQRCKTLSTGKVWDRDWGHGWRAKKFNE